ncbi:MAG: hypothetical protein AUG44_23875 [Actinobacteria bacterium 13_1_20CM_3_71_11]|nr:MAG: hypothetical protein AUG44_23875 [Actinobacteria bacterium 13_1_20CM_3_71_11]
MRIVGGVLLGLALAAGSLASGVGPAGAVVGGARVEGTRFPWVVRLSDGCDGALVASRVVLTAAHCGADTSVRVTAGSSDVRTGVTVGVTAVRQAPGYDPDTQRADWAVLQLDRRLNLRTLAVTPSAAYDSGRFTVLGWGSTREGGPQQRYLRAATVPFASDARCAGAYGGNGFVASDMLCAGRGGVDSCQGDSGGPMVHPDGAGGWLQVGIVSWGNGCGRAGYPGVYTQLSTFSQDIRAAVAALD